MAKQSRQSKMRFDKRGGVITVCRQMIESPNFQTLTSYSRSLITLMQCHWRPDKYVDYGIREAMTRLCCSDKTARRAFDQLQERGFIVCEEQSLFSSRTQSKSRSWRLTWLPYGFDCDPTNDWEQWGAKNAI